MPAFDRLNNRLPDIICGDAHGATLDRNKSEAITRFLREAGLSVSWNHPYAGGFITRGNGDARSSRQAVQIEINRGIYMDGPLRLNQSGTAALAKTVHDLVGFMRDLDPAC